MSGVALKGRIGCKTGCEGEAAGCGWAAIANALRVPGLDLSRDTGTVPHRSYVISPALGDGLKTCGGLLSTRP